MFLKMLKPAAYALAALAVSSLLQYLNDFTTYEGLMIYFMFWIGFILQDIMMEGY